MTRTTVQARETPVASVILPTYNAALYLSEAIESVFAQGLDLLELIIIDDGSTDETPEVLARQDDDRIHVIRTENQGVAAARNVGLDRVRGRYVAFLDADDRWTPNKLMRSIDLLESEPSVGAVFSNFVRFDDQGTDFPDQFTFYPELEQLPARTSRAGRGFVLDCPAFETFVGFVETPGYTQACVYRRSAIERVRFRYPLQWSGAVDFIEDMDFCLRAFKGLGVAYISDPLVEVRRHGSNLTADYRRLALAKLATLRHLLQDELSTSQRHAVKKRLARQWVSVGRFHAGSGRPYQALAAFCHAALGGRLRSALGGVLRLPTDWWRGREWSS